MKLAFNAYSRRPLGQILGEVLQRLRTFPGTLPTSAMLTSRRDRPDLSIDQVVASAERSASDVCTINVASGQVRAKWFYGKKDVPAIWGTVDLQPQDLAAFRRLLTEMCGLVRATYGHSDLEAVTFDDVGHADAVHTNWQVTALHAIYWYNYFGREYQEELVVDAIDSQDAALIEQVKDGMVLVSRATPDTPIDEPRIRRLSAAWPVFRKYNKQACFKTPIVSNYSEVWELDAGPTPTTGSVGQVVGSADDFITSVSIHAQRFNEWAKARGLSPTTEQDFRKIFEEYEAIIRDELLLPAIAAYGETVRAEMGGVWKKAMVFHRGEPVVAKPGRPWAARRVILEVLEGLEPVDV